MAKNVSTPEGKGLPAARYPRSSSELGNRSYVPESQAGDASMFNVTPTRGETRRGPAGSASDHTSPPVND